MKDNNINNTSAPVRANGESNRQKTINLRNKKKQLAVYLNIHKKWVLAILILMVTALVIWFSSDYDKGVNKNPVSSPKIDSSF